MRNQSKIEAIQKEINEKKKPFPVILDSRMSQKRMIYTFKIEMDSRKYVELHILKQELRINWEEAMIVLVNTLKARKTGYMALKTFDDRLLAYARMTPNNLKKPESMAIRNITSAIPEKTTSTYKPMFIYEINPKSNGKLELIYKFKDADMEYNYMKTVKQRKHINRDILKVFFGDNFNEEINKQIQEVIESEK